MHSNFKQLRTLGKTNADRDISSDPAVVGHISIFRQGNEVVAAAYATGGTGQPGAILPLLYRAKLVTMRGDGMLLQGMGTAPRIRSGGHRSEQAGMIGRAAY